MKISTQAKHVGIFSTSFLAALAATYIYSPVAGANAATTANVSVNAGVNAVASISLDASTLNFNITPTASGYFDSKTVTATVDTNSTAGYVLYFSSEDNNTAMTHSDSSITNTIASDFSGTVTSATMAANKWGYSIDNTNFSKIPAANAQATIKNINHYPTSSEKTATVKIGMKLNSSLPSGTYSKNVKFSVLAN